MHCIHVEQRLQVLLDASVLQVFVAFVENERSALSKKISASHEWITPTLMSFLTLSLAYTRKPLTWKKESAIEANARSQFVGCGQFR
jgi:hypothetical protein